MQCRNLGRVCLGVPLRRTALFPFHADPQPAAEAGGERKHAGDSGIAQQLQLYRRQ